MDLRLSFINYHIIEMESFDNLTVTYKKKKLRRVPF